MAMTTPALTTAIVSAVLMVTVIAVDVNTTRTFTLDVFADGEWVTLSTSEQGRNRNERAFMGAEPLARADEYRFRVETQNDYPWGGTKEADVMTNGRVLSTIDVVMVGRGTSTTEFTVEHDAWSGASRVPVPVSEGNFSVHDLSVVIGSTYLYATVSIEGASS